MTTIRTYSISRIATLSLLAGLCLFTGCGGDGSETTSSGAATSNAKACADGADCESCLAISGCNWTGGTCEKDCYQDTDCFGPGNSASPTCP